MQTPTKKKNQKKNIIYRCLSVFFFLLDNFAVELTKPIYLHIRTANKKQHPQVKRLWKSLWIFFGIIIYFCVYKKLLYTTIKSKPKTYTSFVCALQIKVKDMRNVCFRFFFFGVFVFSSYVFLFFRYFCMFYPYFMYTYVQESVCLITELNYIMCIFSLW